MSGRNEPTSAPAPPAIELDRPRSADSLLPLVYKELKDRAARLMSNQRGDHTLQRTALVHEAYMKLAKAGVRFESPLHFFNAAAEAMRHILLDHARSRQRQKRGGGRARIELDEQLVISQQSHDEMDWPALDEAVKALERAAPRRAQIVKLRYFAGLSDADIADMLQMTESAVRRQWTSARAWLYRHMKQAP